jgi:hypothetical protein
VRPWDEEVEVSYVCVTLHIMHPFDQFALLEAITWLSPLLILRYTVDPV